MNNCSFVGYISNKKLELDEIYVKGRPINMVEFTLAVHNRKSIDDNHFNYFKCLAYNDRAVKLAKYGVRGLRIGITAYAKSLKREVGKVTYTETIFVVDTFEVLAKAKDVIEKVEQPVDVECDLEENDMPLDMFDNKVE